MLCSSSCVTVNGGLDVRYSHGFSRRLSNGETGSAKTMLVEDSESEQVTTPSKDGTLVIRQVDVRLAHAVLFHSPPSPLLVCSFCFYRFASEQSENKTSSNDGELEKACAYVMCQ